MEIEKNTVEIGKKSSNQEIEKNLRKLLKYEPLPWQERVRNSDARFKVIAAGARSGKSYFCTFDTKEGLVADLCRPKQYIWIIAPNYDLTQIIWDKAMELVQREPFKHIISRTNNTKGWYKVETVFGTVMEAKSADEPEKLVGRALTHLIVDEAGLVKPKAWRQSLRPRLIDFQGRATFIGTPKGKNWFYDIWSDGQNRKDNPEWESWVFTTFDNPTLSREELDKMTRDKPKYEYNQEILAQFEETAEQYFTNIKGCVRGALQKPDKKSIYTIGMDLGRKSSYSVICAVNERTHHLDHFQRFRRVNWDVCVNRLRKVASDYPHRFIRVDATGIGDPIIEMMIDKGLSIEPYQYAERDTSKKMLMDKANLFIDRSWVTYPNIKILLWELERFGREILESGRVRYKSMGAATSDCVNALALAIWDLSEKPLEKIESEPILQPIQTF